MKCRRSPGVMCCERAIARIDAVRRRPLTADGEESVGGKDKSIRAGGRAASGPPGAFERS